MSIIPIFRWSGKYFGFISNNYFFDSSGNCLGWLDKDRVWCSDGKFFGEIVKSNYILKRTAIAEPAPRAPVTPPAPVVPPVDLMDRVGLVEMVGWEDALDRYR